MISSINGRTRVIGIFGHPVEHSFSPAMHNAAFSHLGLDYVYVPFPVNPRNLAGAVEGIRSLDLAGVNVTIPHKSAVLELLDEVSPEAGLIGAVNTIFNDNGILKGYNTDAAGFVTSLERDRGVTPHGKRVLILGAGGAARAVSVQLAMAGAELITFSTPFPEETAVLKKVITGSTNTAVGEVGWDRDELAGCLNETDILVNATPVGMHPATGEMPPVPLDSLPGDALVCDLIYNPGETMLLKKAKERDLAVLNGLGMLLYQGALAFRLWTGVEAPLGVMRQTLEKQLYSS